MDSQLATSPMDTDFSSAPTTPADSVFSSSSSSSSAAPSPMDMTFGADPFPRECSTTGEQQHPVESPTIVSPTKTCFGAVARRASFVPDLAHRLSSSSSTPDAAEPQQDRQEDTPQIASPSGPSLTTRKSARSPAFAKKLSEMALPLAPLVQLTTGRVHPSFPSTLLRFWLLTDAELEGLAHFYHQRTPCRWTFHYPCPVAWEAGLALEEKRRRIGKFIGLRGCETPVRVRSEDEIMEEARRAREREEEDEVWRRKLHWY
ncbi:hypothetical protein KJ359_005616 [Pestalotiopsis sp. 9143b]|nr:hypothetical protein KJ359_005616 [Pestalotiopsis sp. 9143b]